MGIKHTLFQDSFFLARSMACCSIVSLARQNLTCSSSSPRPGRSTAQDIQEICCCQLNRQDRTVMTTDKQFRVFSHSKKSLGVLTRQVLQHSTQLTAYQAALIHRAVPSSTPIGTSPPEVDHKHHQ